LRSISYPPPPPPLWPPDPRTYLQSSCRTLGERKRWICLQITNVPGLRHQGTNARPSQKDLCLKVQDNILSKIESNPNSSREMQPDGPKLNIAKCTLMIYHLHSVQFFRDLSVRNRLAQVF
jgi:hypothetical protein